MSYGYTHDADTSPSVSREPLHNNQIPPGNQYSDIALTDNASAHFGDVYHQYHGQQRVPLRPSILIPFRRDRDFIEREALNDICRLAAVPAARVALVGLGGVGKTQIAIEYAYRRRETDPDLWVFWVHASNGARFEESYRQIAQQIRIDGWADPKTDFLSTVHVWLSDENNGRWAMVVDNADSSEVVFGSSLDDPNKSSNRVLSDYLPSSANGSIVVTSRSRIVAEGLIEYPEDIIDIGPMVEEDAAALLSKKLKKSQHNLDRDHLVRLARELDFMPLAISQAAAYINQLDSRTTISQYIDHMARNDLDREALLQREIRDPRRDGRASNSIVITWHTSFEHIRRARVSAARLLALMSLFDREGIPRNLLQGRYASDAEWVSKSKQMVDTRDRYDFDGDIAMLKTYNLIRSGVSEHLFDMHRLVQFSTRRWLELHGELSYWQDRYIGILIAEFPSEDYSNWPLCQKLFPHVEATLSYSIASEQYLLGRAVVFHRAAWYALRTGRYRIADHLTRVSLNDREMLLGPNEVVTLESVDTLGVVLGSLGRFEEAEYMHRRALATFREKLGTDCRSTLCSTLNLAMTLHPQKKYEEAEQLCWQVLAVIEANFGLDNQLALQSMRELAVVLQHRRRFLEAESLCRRALATLKKQFGLNHHLTLEILSSLAFILGSQGKHKETEQISRQSLEVCEKHFGPHHPHTLLVVHNLAWSLQLQGDFQQSFRLFNRAVDGRIRVLGPSHPSTLLSQECKRRTLQHSNLASETAASIST